MGSTGSIGRQTLDVVRENSDNFEVISLAAGQNIELLIEQIREFQVQKVVVATEGAAAELRTADVGVKNLQISVGREGSVELAKDPAAPIVMGAILGFEGLFSVLAAVQAGKCVALANKECLVAAGDLLQNEAKRTGAKLVPVDSEHSSIYQCLNRRGAHEDVRRVILTASGGPFLNTPREDLHQVDATAAIKHPRWAMGAKISVDSATLMNKGLEVIEAAVLFGLPPEKIEVLIHPESVVHGLVEYSEGTILAALFATDMRVPIAYALKTLSGMDANISSGVSFLDLAKQQTLRFFSPDDVRFPSLGICYRALRQGGSSPAVLNAANEMAVESFLRNEIKFLQIPSVVEQSLEQVEFRKTKEISDVVWADTEARKTASKILKKVSEIGADVSA